MPVLCACTWVFLVNELSVCSVKDAMERLILSVFSVYDSKLLFGEKI